MDNNNIIQLRWRMFRRYLLILVGMLSIHFKSDLSTPNINFQFYLMALGVPLSIIIIIKITVIACTAFDLCVLSFKISMLGRENIDNSHKMSFHKWTQKTTPLPRTNRNADENAWMFGLFDQIDSLLRNHHGIAGIIVSPRRLVAAFGHAENILWRLNRRCSFRISGKKSEILFIPPY